MGSLGGRHPQRGGGQGDRPLARGQGLPRNAGEPRTLAGMAPLRPRRPALGVGALLLPRDVPEREPRHRHHSAGHEPSGPGRGGLPGRVPREDLARLLVPHAVQRLLDPVQDPARQHRHPRADGDGRGLDVVSPRARRQAGHPRRLLRHPGRVLGLGSDRDPVGLAVRAVQGARQHGGARARDRGRADLPGQPALPPARAPAPRPGAKPCSSPAPPSTPSSRGSVCATWPARSSASSAALSAPSPAARAAGRRPRPRSARPSGPGARSCRRRPARDRFPAGPRAAGPGCG